MRHRYRVDTHANGETSLIKDTPDAPMTVQIDNDITDVGVFATSESAQIPITDEVIDDRGVTRSKEWDDLKAKAHTHHIKIDGQGRITLTPKNRPLG